MPNLTNNVGVLLENSLASAILDEVLRQLGSAMGSLIVVVHPGNIKLNEFLDCPAALTDRAFNPGGPVAGVATLSPMTFAVCALVRNSLKAMMVVVAMVVPQQVSHVEVVVVVVAMMVVPRQVAHVDVVVVMMASIHHDVNMAAAAIAVVAKQSASSLTITAAHSALGKAVVATLNMGCVGHLNRAVFVHVHGLGGNNDIPGERSEATVGSVNVTASEGNSPASRFPGLSERVKDKVEGARSHDALDIKLACDAFLDAACLCSVLLH
jgi:hypothetical protein